MFYYVFCPECKNDLSHFANTDNLDKEAIYCTHCESALRLNYGESFDEDYGCDCGLFWFEKI
ncbi:MAG: hypothetical protein KGZ63_11375 [Clostridiales bacterium]|nr:hypothetical protein [Clostridiales bacterium]